MPQVKKYRKTFYCGRSICTPKWHKPQSQAQ